MNVDSITNPPIRWTGQLALSSQAPATLPLQLNKVAGGQSSWTSALTRRHDVANGDEGLDVAPDLAMADAGTAQCQCKNRTRVSVEQVSKNRERPFSQLLAEGWTYCDGSAYANHTNNAYGLANVVHGVNAASGFNVTGCNGRAQMPAAPFPDEEKTSLRRYALYRRGKRDEQAKREGLTRMQLDKKQKDSLAQRLGYPDYNCRQRAERKKERTGTQPVRIGPVSRKMLDEPIARVQWRDSHNDGMAGLPAGTKTLILTPHAIPCAQPPSILEAFPEVTSDEMSRLLSARSPELPHTI